MVSVGEAVTAGESESVLVRADFAGLLGIMAKDIENLGIPQWQAPKNPSPEMLNQLRERAVFSGLIDRAANLPELLDLVSNLLPWATRCLDELGDSWPGGTPRFMPLVNKVVEVSAGYIAKSDDPDTTAAMLARALFPPSTQGPSRQVRGAKTPAEKAHIKLRIQLLKSFTRYAGNKKVPDNLFAAMSFASALCDIGELHSGFWSSRFLEKRAGQVPDEALWIIHKRLVEGKSVTDGELTKNGSYLMTMRLCRIALDRCKAPDRVNAWITDTKPTTYIELVRYTNTVTSLFNESREASDQIGDIPVSVPNIVWCLQRLLAMTRVPGDQLMRDEDDRVIYIVRRFVESLGKNFKPKT